MQKFMIYCLNRRKGVKHMYYTSSDTLVQASRAGTHEMFTGMSIIAFNAASEAHNLTGVSYPNGAAFGKWGFDYINVPQLMATQQQTNISMLSEDHSYGNTMSYSNSHGKNNGR